MNMMELLLIFILSYEQVLYDLKQFIWKIHLGFQWNDVVDFGIRGFCTNKSIQTQEVHILITDNNYIYKLI